MPLALESNLGPYRIISLLGSGGMGEVYRARDTRLSRDIALKIISTREADEDTLRRFEQEAQAVSALNHPNIVTIHDVGRDEGVAFLVTELVEGESLRIALKQGSLPMLSVLDIGIQIADGLAAAHDEGIIHRDLKPENVMLTRDGRVKILDFGIAKVIGESPGDSSRTLGSNDTIPGLLLGTTAYMSPEQARGTRISYFTDQFSLGLILYEMASGEAAFRRETPLATLSAILTEDPTELTSGSPLFHWLVKRLLHKEPDHRYGSIHDVLRELRNIRACTTEAPPAVSFDAVAAPSRLLPVRWLPVRWIVAGLAAVLVLISIASFLWYRTPSQREVAKEYFPFATGSGISAFPAWSPNGRTIAYSAEVNGIMQLFTCGVGSAAPSQLTWGKEDALAPFWTPDGSRLYYTAGKHLMSVGATGGTPEMVFAETQRGALSSNGTTFAVLREEPTAGTLALFLGTRKKLERYNAGAFGKIHILPASYIRFAPDGRNLGAWLALADGSSEFWMIPIDGGLPERKLAQSELSAVASEFEWLPDGRRIVFTGGTGPSTTSHLFVADTSTGRVDPLTAGTGSEVSPSIAPDGRSVAFASTRADYDIVRIGLNGQVAPVLATSRSETSPSGIANGDSAYITDRHARSEIWLRTGTQGWERPLAGDFSFGEGSAGILYDAAFSPDGRRIAFGRSTLTDQSLWISTLAGDAPVRLAKEPGGAFQRGASWSPDGNSLVYFSMRAGRPVIELTKVGASDPPQVIAENAGTYPRWSPRGDLVASLGPQGGITLLNLDGTGRRTSGSGDWLLHGWAQDGSALYGLRRLQRTLQVVKLDSASGLETVLAETEYDAAAAVWARAMGVNPYSGFSISSDGKGFVTSVLRVRSEIWRLRR